MKKRTLDVGWGSLEEYLDAMKPPITDRRQWGGFAEAAIIAACWNVQVVLFLDLPGGQVAMMTEPVGRGERRICVLWRGTHYDLLIVRDAVWARCSAQ